MSHYITFVFFSIHLKTADIMFNVYICAYKWIGTQQRRHLAITYSHCASLRCGSRQLEVGDTSNALNIWRMVPREKSQMTAPLPSSTGVVCKADSFQISLLSQSPRTADSSFWKASALMHVFPRQKLERLKSWRLCLQTRTLFTPPWWRATKLASFHSRRGNVSIVTNTFQRHCDVKARSKSMSLMSSGGYSKPPPVSKHHFADRTHRIAAT